MSVFQRKTSRGYTREYHFKFMFGKKAYFGVCENCTTKQKAEAYEKIQIETVKRGSEQRTARAYAENMRDILTGGNAINLSDIFQLAMSKPRKKPYSEKQGQRKKAIFDDFLAFMTETYPDITAVSQVQPKHAEEYIALIRTSGRFKKDVIYERGGKELMRQTSEKLSNKTSNDFLMVCKEVFSLVMRDSGLLDNPFSLIPKLSKDETSREAFTEDEIRLISGSDNVFCRNMFFIGFATALREGDVCTLKWEQIDFKKHTITVQMRKTRKTVSIPFGEAFENFLLTLKKGNKSEFVLPEQAGIFLRNSTQISYRIKKFLDGLGIKNTVSPSGLKRQISVKDFHSCRHTFCYYAGVNNIQLPIVQNIVGHMSPSMTAHYMAHIRDEDKQAILTKLPSFLIGTTAAIEAPTKGISLEFKAAIMKLSKPQLFKVLSKIETYLDDKAKNEVIFYCQTLGSN